jgi:hypothetical protein
MVNQNISDVKISPKKLLLVFVVVIIVFLALFSVFSLSNKPQIKYKTKAAEVKTTPSAVKPDLIGTIAQVQNINSGNTVLIMNGVSKNDYLNSQLSAGDKTKEQKYLLILTPKTKVNKVGETTSLPKSILKKEMNIYVYTTSDLAVGLKVIISE